MKELLEEAEAAKQASARAMEEAVEEVPCQEQPYPEEAAEESPCQVSLEIITSLCFARDYGVI